MSNFVKQLLMSIIIFGASVRSAEYVIFYNLYIF